MTKQCCPLSFPDHVPFKDFLVDPDPKHMEPPEYIHKIKCPPNWEIIFEKESLSECSHKDESSTDYSLLNDFDGIRLNSSCKAKLDETQLAAVELALKNRLVLIQVMIQGCQKSKFKKNPKFRFLK